MNSKTTIIGLVAAIAVLSGAMGLSVTGGFGDLKMANAPTNIATGFLMGHLEIEARNADGELIAYRSLDNAVVDDGEQCILKMLFETSDAAVGRGGTATVSEANNSACQGVLTGAWDVIAIGSGTTNHGTTLGVFAAGKHDLFVGLETELLANGMQRTDATTKTWTNGSGATTTKIVLAHTFTSDLDGTISVTESGLFNSTAAGSDAARNNGMLAHNTFATVSLQENDSITVTWTFTVGD